MFLNLRIAWGFLLAKKRAMLMSLTGITFGVGFFVLTQAQTSGFEKLFIRTILGTNGHIRLQDQFRPSVDTLQAQSEGEAGGFTVPLRNTGNWTPGVDNVDFIKQKVREFTTVTGVAGVIRGRAEISSGFRSESIQALGIDPREYGEVSDLELQVIYGSLAQFGENVQGILLGTILARRLDVDLGNSVFLSSQGETRRFKVAGVFRTGVDEYDKRTAFIHSREARRVFAKPHGVTYLQITIDDPEAAPEAAAHMESVLRHHVASWQERERTWLELFRVLRLSSGVTMSVILLIAGLGMFNTLAIIVMERAREIAILRSMGYTKNDITSIFLAQGMIVLAAGIILGFVLGAGLTYGIERVPFNLRGIFASDHFVVNWSAWHYLYAGAVASVVVALASLFPARRAATFEPGDVIRGMGE